MKSAARGDYADNACGRRREGKQNSLLKGNRIFFLSFFHVLTRIRSITRITRTPARFWTCASKKKPQNKTRKQTNKTKLKDVRWNFLSRIVSFCRKQRAKNEEMHGTESEGGGRKRTCVHVSPPGFASPEMQGAPLCKPTHTFGFWTANEGARACGDPGDCPRPRGDLVLTFRVRPVNIKVYCLHTTKGSPWWVAVCSPPLWVVAVWWG